MNKVNLLQSLCLWLLIILLCIGNVSASSDDGEKKDDPAVIIMFMFFGLALGVIIMQLISVFGEVIPYTVVVFILGIIISTAAKDQGTFGQSIADWVSIDTNALLYVFIPPLVFGEVMNLNWFHLKGGLIQSLLLAGPGVVFGALVMGALTKVILPYHWSWNLAMTFGSVLAATDPVSVIALLKSGYASPKLTILIVGESILNDGVSMVLFTFFFNNLNGRHYDAGSVIGFFFAACMGSIALGAGFGLVFVAWLRSASRPLKEVDVTIQIALTICCAYLAFFASQYSLEISGILACFGAGAILAWLGPPIILSHETMHNVWGMMEWVLNTLIFLLAGLIIGHRVLGQVKAIDWLYCIVLYIILMALRFVMVGVLYPWISTIGHKCTKKEAVFMSWAGLRGAVSMILGLYVEKGGPSDLDSETSRLFFFVGGIVALTLLVNATTAQQLLVWLGLLGVEPPEKAIVMTQTRIRLRRKMEIEVKQIAGQFGFNTKEMDDAKASCSLFSEDSVVSEIEMVERELEDEEVEEDVNEEDKILDISEVTVTAPSTPSQNSNARLRRRNENGETASANRVKQRSGKRTRVNLRLGNQKRNKSASRELAQTNESVGQRGPNRVLMHELLGHVRAIFLEIVKVRYWNHIEGGKLPRLSHSAQFLLYSIEVGLDQVNELEGAKDWDYIQVELCRSPFHVTVLRYLEGRLCSRIISHLLGYADVKKEAHIIYCLTSFIEAHKYAQDKLRSFMGEKSQFRFSQHPEESKVIAESKEAVGKAEQLLSTMSPDKLTAIRSKQAARLVLAKEAEMVKSMMQEGLISHNHAEEFLEEIGEDTARIEKERNQMFWEQVRLRWEAKIAQFAEDRALLSSRESMV